MLETPTFFPFSSPTERTSGRAVQPIHRTAISTKQKPNRRPSKRRQESCSALCRKIHIATDERLYPHSRRHHDQVDVKPLLAIETSVLGDCERCGCRSNGGNRCMNFFELLRFGWRQRPKESKEQKKENKEHQSTF